MEITLRLYGALGRYRPADAPAMGAFPMRVEEGATVADLVERLGIPPSWVRGAFVNDQQVGLSGVLSPGDQVNLFPPAGGGEA